MPQSLLLPQDQLQPTPLFYRGQGLPTSRPKRPFAPRERRRDDELGPGPEKHALKTKRLDGLKAHIRPVGEICGLENAVDGRDDARLHDSIS